MSETGPRQDEMLFHNPGGAWNDHLDKLVEEQDAVISMDQMLSMHRLLADRLGDHDIVPMGFVMAMTLLTYDLNKGVSGFTGEPMPSDVTNLPPIIYRMFEMDATGRVHDVMGEEFGQAVDDIIASVREPKN